jgi:hypothetical protein
MARSAAGAIAIVVLFAAATPMIEPSAMSIGTLFSYLGAVAILVPHAAMLLIRTIVRTKTRNCLHGAPRHELHLVESTDQSNTELASWSPLKTGCIVSAASGCSY